MLRTLLASALLIVAISYSPSASAQNISPEKLEAAKAYLEVADVNNLLNEMTKQVAATLPENIRAGFVEHMNGIDKEAFNAAMIASMAKHFSVEELHALAAFYGSKEGQSIMKKMPMYMAEMMPIIQKIFTERAQTFSA